MILLFIPITMEIWIIWIVSEQVANFSSDLCSSWNNLQIKEFNVPGSIKWRCQSFQKIVNHDNICLDKLPKNQCMNITRPWTIRIICCIDHFGNKCGYPVEGFNLYFFIREVFDNLIYVLMYSGGSVSMSTFSPGKSAYWKSSPNSVSFSVER